MDISFDGTLSLDEFSVSAHAFAEKWQRNDFASSQWLWVNCQNGPLVASNKAEGYLALENICFLRSSEEIHAEVNCFREEDANLFEKESTIDDAMLVPSDHSEVHYYDFHIVYSASYRVPVLYFRAYCSDGRPVLLNEIEKNLPASSSKVLLESKWTFITHEEHPYLNRPWYKLHPCGTGEWMKLLFQDAAVADNAVERYLVSWLSVVGQVVGITVPIEMVNDHNSVIDGHHSPKE